MDEVLESLSQLSTEINGFLNGTVKFTRNNLFVSVGKLFDKEDDADTALKECSGREKIDCRSQCVDKEVKRLIKEKIYDAICKFHDQKNGDDQFLLFLGFCINIYYVVGLYAEFGKFDIDRVINNIEDRRVRDYGILINEYLHSLIVEGFLNVIPKLEFDDLERFEEILQSYIDDHKQIEINDLVEVMNDNCQNFIPELYRMFSEHGLEIDSEKYSNEILEKMTSQYPDFKFGWVYQCLNEGIEFYRSKGENIHVYECKKILGVDLFLHIIGLRTLDNGKTVITPNGIRTTGGTLNSICGIGIPEIKIRVKEKNSNEIYLNKNIVENDKRSQISFETIRKQTEQALRIGFLVEVGTNPIEYTAGLFKVVEEQKKELQEKNIRLERNAERNKEMMDYYAHTWKHISYPQIVKEVAEELGKTDRITANRLMKVYNSERTLQRGIELLQYISSNDENEVRKKFRDGIAKSASNATGFFDIFRVICDSLDLVVFKILMVESDDSTSIKRCREKWKLRSPLDELREEYTTLFLEEKTDGYNIFEWTKANLINLELDISNEWNEVRFREDGFAINQFKEILVEIFTNIFLHGDEKARISFFQNEHEMIIRETNGCIDTNPGSQSGISTMRRVLEYLNVGTDIQSLETELEENYTLTIRLDKRLLIRRGRRS